MNDQNQNHFLRDYFRQEIRNRQIQQIFAFRRREFALESQKYEQQTNSNGANNQLMRQSLIKNNLLSKLEWLLPSMQKKIKDKPSIKNVEFVVSISCNILKDDISIDQKQYIYRYCVDGISLVDIKNLSPIVEVYFYETVFQQCYEYFDERYQIQIEQKIIPRLVNLLMLESINMKSVPEQYTQDECQAEIYEGILNSFYYYYLPDNDHNNTLLYKVKRTSTYLNKLIEWIYQKLDELKYFPNFELLFKLILSMFSKVVEVPMNISVIIGQQMTLHLMEIMIVSISFQEQRLQKIKSKAVVCLNWILRDQMDIFYKNLNENILKLMARELQGSIEQEYQKQLMKLFTTIALQFPDGMQEQIIKKYLQYVIGIAKQIIGTYDWNIELDKLKICLQLIRSILSRGESAGDSSYSYYFSSCGAGKQIDEVYLKMKNEEIQKIIEDIYLLVQLC